MFESETTHITFPIASLTLAAIGLTDGISADQLITCLSCVIRWTLT